MKLTQLEIKNFGPLSLSVPIKFSWFNLLWGLNERGKSLIIEAILNNLPLEVSERGFDKKILRVNEQGGVNLEIEHKGILYSKSLRRLLTLSLTKQEIFNYYFILNSVVTYQKDKEVLQSALDRLSSTYIDVLESVKKKILEINRVTETFSLKNSSEDAYLFDRFNQAKEIISEIDKLISQIQDENLDELEIRYAELKRELEELLKKEDTFKLEKNKKLVGRTEELINLYEDYKSRLDIYKHFTDEVYENYRNLYLELEKIAAELNSIKEKDLKSLSEQIDALASKLTEMPKIKSELQRLELTKKLLDEKIIRFKQEEPKYQENLKKKKLMQVLYILFGVLFVAVLTSSVFLRNNLLFILAFLIFAATFTFVLLYGKALNEIKEFGQLKSEIFDRARGLGFNLTDVDLIAEKLDSLRTELEARDREMEKIKSEKNALDYVFKSKENELKNLELKKAEIEGKIEYDDQRLGVKNFTELEEKLKDKKEIENKLHGFFNELKGLWQTSISSFENEDDFFIKVGEELRKIRSQQYSEEVSFSLDSIDLDYLTKRKQEIQNEIVEIEKKLAGLREKFSKVAFGAEKALGSAVRINNISELMGCKDELSSFVEDCDKKLKLSRKLIEIINSEIKENRDRLNYLFSDMTETSNIFKEITGGRYKNIKYDDVAKTLFLEDSKGNILEVNKLSGGTIDQLFFAIRLGIGMKILQDEKGFFVLDDPFVKSDSERLKRELELLIKLAQEGWQILLFSCKDEVKDYLLSNHQDSVNFIDLNQLTILSHEI